MTERAKPSLGPNFKTCGPCSWTYLGIGIHLVFWSWEVMAFSNSSNPFVFLSFLTKLLTAFSLHLSSPSPFFQPKRRLTIGGVKGSIDVIATLMQIFTKRCLWIVQKPSFIWLFLLYNIKTYTIRLSLGQHQYFKATIS